MSKQLTQITTIGRYILTALLITFTALKLNGDITWSWWWVLAPLWAPIALAVLIVFALGAMMVNAYARADRPKE